MRKRERVAASRLAVHIDVRIRVTPYNNAHRCATAPTWRISRLSTDEKARCLMTTMTRRRRHCRGTPEQMPKYRGAHQRTDRRLASRCHMRQRRRRVAKDRGIVAISGVDIAPSLPIITDDLEVKRAADIEITVAEICEQESRHERQYRLVSEQVSPQRIWRDATFNIVARNICTTRHRCNSTRGVRFRACTQVTVISACRSSPTRRFATGWTSASEVSARTSAAHMTSFTRRLRLLR